VRVYTAEIHEEGDGWLLIGIFSTREKAQEKLDSYRGSAFNKEIGEYELDGDPMPLFGWEAKP
jgi:hypothetical protein